MSLDIYERREYRQNGFVYLLDDEEKTAWIKEGRIKRCRRYRLPDHVMVDGERYTVESVEAGAYNRPRTLRHLIIPDSFNYVDEWAFCCDNLRSVYIGKKMDYIDNLTFCHCKKLHHIHIDKDNLHLKTFNGMVLSKDGKKVLTWFRERRHLTIPEGVEEIDDIVFINNFTLESVCFPKNLRKMGDNSFGNCPKLRKVFLPGDFEKFRTQSFLDNKNLKCVDLPSTLTDLGGMIFTNCPNLETVVLRSPEKLEYGDCLGAYLYDKPLANAKLYVPADLVEQYRQDPEWGLFQHIFAIEKYANYEIPFQTLSDHDEVFNLNKIPMDVLDNGWKRYRPYLLKGDEQHPFNFGRPVGGDTTLAVLQNIKKLIVNTFEIDEKQFVIMNDYQGLSASVLVALCDDNVEVMEAAMQTQGYFKENVACTHLLEDQKGRRWMNVRFKIAGRERVSSAWSYLYERIN